MSVASSLAERRVHEIKMQAVLELYLREGPFWEAVNRVRSEWEIVPVVGLPPEDLPTPTLSDDPNVQHWLLQRFRSDIEHLRLKVGRGRFFRAADWEKFVTACVFYDPPESNEGDDLLTFAEYGGINLQRADRRGLPDEGAEGKAARVVAPLVRWVPNQAQSQLKIQRYFEAIIDGLIEWYVEPTGKDGAEALDEIIRERRLEELLAAPVDREPAIFPDENTNEDDLTAAYAAIRSNRGGRTPMNSLVAVVAAIKHEDHNHRDSQKRSERRYAYPKLAETLKDYGVRTDTKNPGSSARAHVKLGKRLRAVREKNLEK